MRHALAASAACLLVLCSHAAAQTTTRAQTTPHASNTTTTPAPSALAMPWLPSTAVFSATSCSAAEVEAAVQCQAREAAAFTGTEPCAALSIMARCWPRCFCVHPLGYLQLAGSLRAVCPTLPSCGPPQPVLTMGPSPAGSPSSHAHRAAPPAAGLLGGWAGGWAGAWGCAWALAPLATAALGARV
jgi:hypothetical protein